MEKTMRFFLALTKCKKKETEPLRLIDREVVLTLTDLHMFSCHDGVKLWLPFKTRTLLLIITHDASHAPLFQMLHS